MTLRSRLVAALSAVFAIGMVVYGIGTYRAFAAAELARLDDEVRDTVALVERELAGAAGDGPPGETGPPADGSGGPGRDGRDGDPPRRVAPGTYAVVLASDGSVRSSLQVGGGDAVPDLRDLPSADVPVTRPSLEGAGSWRVLGKTGADGRRIVVAVPLTSVDEALGGLLLIEVVAGTSLLAALAAGSWVVLRTGLRPLEEMAAATRTISAGELDRRVPVDARSSEVGQLGTAINGMLDDLERAFAQRAATEAKLRRFVADASHELRTPLTSIQGYAELFRLGQQREGGDPLELDVIARRIEGEAGRMRRLVDDLLTLARLDDPRPAAIGPVDLAVVAADACTDAVARDPDRPLQLDAPEPVVVQGDEGHLRQAVTNLVANAMRHTPAGTPIEVTALRRAQEAVVVVRDHGPGLGAEAQARAFDRFWQADPSRAGTGAGLGLSIVQAIATEHGGTAAAADHPEGGAVVTLTIPLDARGADSQDAAHDP
jgi:two-component system, OmpR family, sensor kinase